MGCLGQLDHEVTEKGTAQLPAVLAREKLPGSPSWGDNSGLRAREGGSVRDQVSQLFPWGHSLLEAALGRDSGLVAGVR